MPIFCAWPRRRIHDMTRDVAKLLRAARELPESDRAELAGRLLESLEGEPDEGVEIAWAEEIGRRLRQLDSGEGKTIPWPQVRAKLLSSMGKAKIAVTVNQEALGEIDRLVAEGVFSDRSNAIESAVKKYIEKLHRSSLARECAKLDPAVEQALAEEHYVADAEWPEY